MKRDFRNWFSPGSFAPIPTNDSYNNSRRPFAAQLPSSWQRFVAWVRYYSIQTRWDIERWLARRLHRRWS